MFIMTRDAEEEDATEYGSFTEEGDYELEEARRIRDTSRDVFEELQDIEEEYQTLKGRYVETQAELEESMAR